MKIEQLYDKRRLRKRKTTIKRANLNPVYHETLEFQIEDEQIDRTNLLVTVMDWDRSARQLFQRIVAPQLDISAMTQNWLGRPARLLRARARLPHRGGQGSMARGVRQHPPKQYGHYVCQQGRRRQVRAGECQYIIANN